MLSSKESTDHLGKVVSHFRWFIGHKFFKTANIFRGIFIQFIKPQIENIHSSKLEVSTVGSGQLKIFRSFGYYTRLPC